MQTHFRMFVRTSLMLAGSVFALAMMANVSSGQLVPRLRKGADPAPAARDAVPPAADAAPDAVPDAQPRDAARDAARDARDAAKGARDAARDTTKGARDAARDAADDAGDAAKGARRDARDARRDARDTARDARDDARDAADGTRAGARAGARAEAGAEVSAENIRAADLGLWFASGARAGAEGLVIADIAAQGAIAKVGFQEGDRIVSINGMPVRTEREFLRYLWADDIRTERVKVIVFRGGREQILYIQPSLIIEEVVTYDPLWHYGLVIDDRYPDRIVVLRVYPRTPAYYAGLRAGDVIVNLGGRRVATVTEFTRALSSAEGQLDLQVSRGNRTRELALDTSAVAEGGTRATLRPDIDDASERVEGRLEGRPDDPQLRFKEGRAKTRTEGATEGRTEGRVKGRAETPDTEDPADDRPKLDRPKSDRPDVPKRRTETPKADAPKADTPKVDPSEVPEAAPRTPETPERAPETPKAAEGAPETPKAAGGTETPKTPE